MTTIGIESTHQRAWGEFPLTATPNPSVFTKLRQIKQSCLSKDSAQNRNRIELQPVIQQLRVDAPQGKLTAARIAELTDQII